MKMIINEKTDYIAVSFPSDNPKLTILIVDEFKKSLFKLIDENQGVIILDMANVSFIDSSGFGALVTVFTHAKNQQACLKLCCVNPMVMSLIKITKLDEVFEIYETFEVAVKSI